jgi:2-alkenal reductase
LTRTRLIPVIVLATFVLAACNFSPITSTLSSADTPSQNSEPQKSETVDTDAGDLENLRVAAQASETLAPEPTPVPSALINQADAEELLLINIYERVNPSVVNIVVTVEDDELAGSLPENLFPAQGQGSGFIVDNNGHIVTNNHVIQDAKKVEVTFYDGATVSAEVVGADPDSDIAVIKVDAPGENLRPITWGDSDALKVGQRAIAIGNPFGLDGTLTTGIISALGRSLPTETGAFRIPEIIQTDAAINPGNSGGPLLNSQGEVIGINTAIVPRREGQFGAERSFLGVGFAVPANLVKRVAPSLIESGKYQHPWIGFSGNTVTNEIAEAMKLLEVKGALVVEVISGSPADDAGLRGGTRDIVFDNGLDTTIGGDVIIAIDDEEIKGFDDLISFLSRRGEVGKVVTLTIIRDGKEQTLELTLGPRPEADEVN